MILDNLNEDMRAFFSLGSSKIILFFSFALGTGLALDMLVGRGLSGILLGIGIIFPRLINNLKFF